jgi:hypothetical protein
VPREVSNKIGDYFLPEVLVFIFQIYWCDVFIRVVLTVSTVSKIKRNIS